MTAPSLPSIKLVLVGDTGVGKSTLLLSYTSNYNFSQEAPQVAENYENKITVAGKPAQLSIWDTASDGDMERLRPLCYHQTDIFLICFSINSENSLTAAQAKWNIEVHHHVKESRTLLVGTKGDLRDKGSAKVVSKEDAEKAAISMNAIRYMECSALTKVGLTEVFDLAIKSALAEQTEQQNTVVVSKRSGCVLL